MNSWQVFLCEFLGCSKVYAECMTDLCRCHQLVEEKNIQIADAKETIRQLELLVPRPTPPEIDSIAQKDSAWIQSVIDSMNLGIIRLPLDEVYYLTNKTNFLNIVAWDWIDTVKYRVDIFDCENFAISFKAQVDEVFNLNQVGIVIDYVSGHAYNLVIFPDGKVMVLEPQMDNLVCWTKRLKDFYSLQGAIVLI